MSMMHLIVNADDFGFSPEINRGIIQSFTNGIVTDTSLLIRSPYAKEAMQQAIEVGLPVGIHVDLVTDFVESNNMAEKPFLGPNGTLRTELSSRENEKEIRNLYSCEELVSFREEIRNQIEDFMQLTGHKPSHLDYHFGLHYLPDVMTIYVVAAKEYGIPVRWGEQYAGKNPYQQSPNKFCDSFRGTPGVSVDDFMEMIKEPWDGVLEVCCHPGYRTPFGLQDSYNEEREYELSVLCDPQLKAALSNKQIQLVNYHWLQECLSTTGYLAEK